MKELYLYVIIVSLPISTDCVSNTVASQLNKEQTVKIWCRYLEELLSLTYRRLYTQLWHIYTQTLSSQLWKLTSFRRYHEQDITGVIPKQDINITKIYGNIRSTLVDILKQGTNEYITYFFTELLRNKPPFNFTWRFNINKKMSLNLTFDSIYLANCRSYLVIRNGVGKTVMFPYCGLHAKASIFLKLRNVIVEVFVQKRLYPSYRIIGSFSVMEKRLVTSLQRSDAIKKQSTHSEIKLEQILLFKSDGLVFYFWVHVHKDSHAILKHLSSESQKIKIYDGPGILSNLLLPRRKVYKCSTYQCTVLVSWVFRNSELLLNHSAEELYFS